MAEILVTEVRNYTKTTTTKLSYTKSTFCGTCHLSHSKDTMIELFL